MSLLRQRQRPMKLKAIAVGASIGVSLLLASTQEWHAQTLPSLSPGAKNLLQSLDFQPYQPSFPKVERIPLSQTAMLYHIAESATETLQKIVLIFPHGENAETADQMPALQLITSWLEESGTRNLPFPEFRRTLQQIGARIRVVPAYENWTIELQYLAQAETEALQLLSDFILHPDLKVETLAVVKKNAAAKIRERFARPATIARLIAMQQVYPNSRYSALYQQSHLDSLDALRLKKILRHRLHPKKLSLLYTGKILLPKTIVQMQNLLDEMEKAYPQTRPYHQRTAEILRGQSPKLQKIVFVAREKTAQAAIALAAPLPSLRDPTQIPFQLGNSILGGESFTSRLSVRIRDQAGLAYFVYSYPSYLTNVGTWLAMMGTKPSQIAQALRISLAEIEKIRQIRQEELLLSQNSLINRLLFQFENSEQTLWQSYRIDARKLPQNYLETYVTRVKLAETAQIAQVTANLLDAKNIHIVIVGPPSFVAHLQKDFPDFAVELVSVPGMPEIPKMPKKIMEKKEL